MAMFFIIFVKTIQHQRMNDDFKFIERWSSAFILASILGFFWFITMLILHRYDDHLDDALQRMEDKL